MKSLLKERRLGMRRFGSLWLSSAVCWLRAFYLSWSRGLPPSNCRKRLSFLWTLVEEAAEEAVLNVQLILMFGLLLTRVSGLQASS